jgi:hypothetical protein
MQSDRATARIVGVLFIVATATAVIGDRLLRPIRDDAEFLTDFAGDEDRVIIGVLTEVVLALSVIAIAALLFPILKRRNEGMALTYVGVRILEGAIIVVGALSSLLLLSASEEFTKAGASDASLKPVGELLIEVREWTDLLGPAIVFGVSALILYTLLYQAEIVPRFLSVWGFIGAVLLLVAGVLQMWGESSTSVTSILLTIPIGLNEMVLAVWLIVRGFETPAGSERV